MGSSEQENKTPVKIRILIPIFFLFVFGVCLAQTLSTMETKVVFVVDAESEIVTCLILFTKMQKMDKARLFEGYKDSKFYVGLLKGSYNISDEHIVPQKNTTIIMYTDKQIFPESFFSPADTLVPGDCLDLGATKTEVVANRKGELIVKT